jgi:glucosamine-6-phosphate deaminase
VEVIIVDGARIGVLVADEIQALLATKPDAVLGLATGSSPLSVYDELARRTSAGLISFSRARAFTLDEYVGLPAGHPCSYDTVIKEQFTSRVDFGPAAIRSPDGRAVDLVGACRTYESAIRDAGGVDLQILGIGTDGHIAFNEPGSSLGSRTRVKALTMQTRRDNARFFAGGIDEVPRHCITQGLGTIMGAARVVLVATGEEKSEAVEHLVEGAVSARWPATVLQHHPSVTVVVDPSAASRLQLTDYYRYAYESRDAVGPDRASASATLRHLRHRQASRRVSARADRQADLCR